VRSWQRIGMSNEECGLSTKLRSGSKVGSGGLVGSASTGPGRAARRGNYSPAARPCFLPPLGALRGASLARDALTVCVGYGPLSPRIRSFYDARRSARASG
jgi:hypothetical protein